jgi:hypothetical protein
MGIEQKRAGDGTVPIWSSTLPGTQFLYITGTHGTIYKTDDLRRTLASLLGAEGVLAAGDVTEISLQREVVEPNETIHAALKFDKDTDKVRGRITIDRFESDSGGGPTKISPVSTYQVEYTGPTIETLSATFDAPNRRGHYKIAFFSESATQSSAAVELIVQDVD